MGAGGAKWVVGRLWRVLFIFLLGTNDTNSSFEKNIERLVDVQQRVGIKGPLDYAEGREGTM